MTDEETLALLCARVAYCPESGVLTWLKRPVDYGRQGSEYFNQRFGGKPLARLRRPNGTWFILLRLKDDKRHVSYARAAWAVHHGKWPKGVVDHIDGNPHNNVLTNLRDVSSQVNSRNCGISTKNTSGVIGVRRYRGRWAASIGHRPERWLGTYPTFEAAVAARRAAEAALGYHPNHGSRPSITLAGLA